MRTGYLTHAKNVLGKALESDVELSASEWKAVAAAAMEDIRNTLLFARNATSKGFLSTTNMSEAQICETEQYKRIAGLHPGEGCTISIEPDLYRYIRWIVKRDNPVARLRTIKLDNNVISVSRID